MKFLYPEFLFGLAALAIPIIIHLFNFRKARKVYFSSTRFLKHIKQSTSQKRKLKHYLILASRLLFLFFLVIAFAQPYLPSADKNPQSENVYIYLDNSQSMSNRVNEDETALGRGLNYMSEIIKLYPANANYKLITNDFAPFSNTLKTRDELEDLITEIKLSNTSRTLDEVYNRLVSGDWAKQIGNKDIYLISDFQRSTAGNPPDWKTDSTDQIIAAPIEFKSTSNVFVDSMYLSSPYLLASEHNQLNVVLRNDGKQEVHDLLIKLFVNQIQSANSSVDIQPGTTAKINFEINSELKKINACRVSFDDFPVTFDNDFYFTLKLQDKINILEIKSGDAITPVEQVYANSNLFNFKSQNIANLNYSLVRQSDLVIINGVDNIDASLGAVLNEYLDQHGTMMLIPGDNPNIPGYQSLLNIALEPASVNEKETLAGIDFSNPFFENMFESTKDNFLMPTAKNIIRWGADQNTLLSLRNGIKFLSEFKRNGTVYVLGAPLEDAYTDFYRHAIFVPVMYRIATLSKKSYDQLYYTIDAPMVNLRMDSLDRQDVFKLKNGEEELIPAQRITDNELFLELPKYTLNPGIYQLTLNDQTKGLLAFNIDKKESRLEQYSLQELRNYFSLNKNVTIFEAKAASDFSAEVKNKKFGVPLWKYALILALIFLLTEVLIIRFL